MKNWSLVIASVLILMVGLVSFQVQDLTGQASKFTSEEYGRFYPDELNLNVDHASCTWKKDHYEACAQVSWKGLDGYYLKAFIPGGDVNSKYTEKTYQQPYTFCTNLKQYSGKRNVHAYLYTPSNSLKRIDIDNQIECNKDSESKTKKVTKRYSLTIETSDRSRNTGTKTFDGLGGKPIACKVSGTWKTRNRKNVGVSHSFCHGATGSFYGEFSEGNQYVTNDPNFFDYMDLGASSARDPAPRTYDGYTLYTRTCDAVKFEEGRYYARAKVVSLHEGAFTMDWEYNNGGTRPAVDFLFNVECDVEVEGLKYPPTKAKPVIESPAPLSIPEEAKPAPAIEPEIVKERPRPLIFNLVDWIKSLF